MAIEERIILKTKRKKKKKGEVCVMAVESLSEVYSGYVFDIFFSEVDNAVASFKTSDPVLDIAYSSAHTPRGEHPMEYTAIIMLDNA